MSLLLIGIVAEHAPLTIKPDRQLIKAAGLAAIVKASDTDLSREPAIVLAFGEQIIRIHQQTTLIPMRYGNVLTDENAVIQHLTDHAAPYHARLVALDDCEEMGIRLRLDTPADNPVTTSPVSGYDYLLARKRAYAIPEQAEQQATLLNNGLAGLYRQHCAEISVFNGQQTYLLSYLVPRAQLPVFRERLHTLANSIKESGFISGPWPPYNFAS